MTTQHGVLSSEYQKVVVFDTNAYRNLTHGLSVQEAKDTARRLADVELAGGYKALANPYVIWELLSHLAIIEDPAYSICQCALVALVEHTRAQDDAEGGVCRVADGETELMRQLFGKQSSIAEQNAQSLSCLASYVWKFAPELTDFNAQTNFEIFAAKMNELESRWLDNMEDLLMSLRSEQTAISNGKDDGDTSLKSKRKYLNSSGFERACSEGKVLSLSSLLGLALSEDGLKVLTDRLQEIFPVSLRLMRKTIAGWYDAPEVNLRSAKKKRANFIWDTALCFGIGPEHQIGDAGILFVTDDRAIVDACVAADCSDSVLHFQNYKASISFVS